MIYPDNSVCDTLILNNYNIMEQKYWKEILGEIKTPIGLAGLIVLMAGAVFTYLFSQVDDGHVMKAYYPLIMLVFLLSVLGISILGSILNKRGLKEDVCGEPQTLERF